VIGYARHAPTHVTASRWISRTAVVAMSASIALTVVLGIQGPASGSAVARSPAGCACSTVLPAAPPWPPWSFHLRPAPLLVSITMWLVELLGGVGLALGLIAVRRGWRPKPRRVIAASVVAVAALMVLPPVDNGDPTIYAAFGRIAALGHSPYVMTPGQLRSSGDPVGRIVKVYWNLPSRYGPVATVTEAAASELAGDSAPHTIFWLKVWNALAYLAVVLALDRVVRSDAARRARAHLLWSVNPLMLFAIMANGHNDVVAVAAGASALFVLRRVESRRALLAGVLVGLATAFKAQYALFGAGLAWAARRSPRALAALAVGAVAILVPSYLLAGRAAISATGGMIHLPPTGPWLAVAKVLGWADSIARINVLGLIGSAVLAAILLWRMPQGPRELPAVRIALALALGLLILSPQQTAWYDAMIFPLLAVMPATRLDWIVVGRATALAAISQPYFVRLDPAWLITIENSKLTSPNLVLGALVIALLWLCTTRAWNPIPGQADRLVTAIRADPGARSPT
jgi:hypothetical protein